VPHVPSVDPGLVLVVTRYRVPEAEARAFLEQVRTALRVLCACPGVLRGRVGRATDDPQLWTLTCEWTSVGAYRRALSSYDVKLHAVPLMSRALDEPTAFEVLQAEGDDAGPGNTRRAADAGTVGVGEASAPDVRTDLGN
jgi:quinol monooxygenase YgiN